jgi:hypothetical protein
MNDDFDNGGADRFAGYEDDNSTFFEVDTSTNNRRTYKVPDSFDTVIKKDIRERSKKELRKFKDRPRASKNFKVNKKGNRHKWSTPVKH